MMTLDSINLNGDESSLPLSNMEINPKLFTSNLYKKKKPISILLVDD